MRLKSELYETRDGGKDVHWNRESEVEHDAMAAHALLQAMDDLGQCFLTPSDPATWIEERAAEILAGWLGEE